MGANVQPNGLCCVQRALAGALIPVYLEVVSPIESIVEDLKPLPPARLEVAADFVQRLKRISEEERQEILTRTAGALSPEDADAMARYEKRPEYVRAARDGNWEALVPRDRALCLYAEKLTKVPNQMAEEDVAALRTAGLGDAEILDVAQIAAYFNFVNRIVLGLGVAVEDDEARRGFKY